MIYANGKYYKQIKPVTQKQKEKDKEQEKPRIMYRFGNEFRFIRL